VRKTLPLYEAALRRLEELRPPSADVATVHRWLAADRRVAKAVRSLGEAAERRDFPSVTAAASQAQLAGSESRRAATALGVHACARVASGR
jgi:LmbE family N-acetylglucosaminyl deacetylase